jgi:hypothetical protein
VRIMQILGTGWVIRVSVVACGVISWRAALLALAILVVRGMLRLFTEWQRRQTFTALLRDAPDGTVIVQHDGPGGQAMKVTWGNSAESAVQSSRACP